jgi:2-polyprenyl-3-methyl-5-hydroxy-6-metoxy-1,4-benzoquinol methylase
VEDNTHYAPKLGYASSHTYAVDAVPRGAKVIDIGAGPGAIAEELVRKGCEVTVVDRYPAKTSSPHIRVLQQDLDAELKFDVKEYEYILLLDMIEHLHEPERFIETLRSQFDYTPKTIILTTPNIASMVQRLMLLLGQFNYGKAGVLDVTHTRLFTFRTLRRLLRDAGFKIKTIKGVPAPFPKVLGNGLAGRAAVNLNLLAIRVSKTLFSYQIYVEAESTPDVTFLLRDAKEKSALRGAVVLAESRVQGSHLS